MREPASPAGCINGAVESSSGAASHGTAPDESRRERMRVAFYGRTNQRGPEAVIDVARQLELCRAVIGQHAEITQVFFDSPEPVTSRIPASGVRSPRREGGWETLAAAMTAPATRRGFAAVICMAAQSVSRHIRLLTAREKFAEHHGVPILYADELTEPAEHRALIRQIRRSPVSSPPVAAGVEAETTSGTPRARERVTARWALRRGRQVTG